MFISVIDAISGLLRGVEFSWSETDGGLSPAGPSTHPLCQPTLSSGVFLQDLLPASLPNLCGLLTR